MFENINFAPLPSSFLVISMIGLIAVVVYREALGLAWTFALALFCLILFIASFLSMHYGPVSEKEIKF